MQSLPERQSASGAPLQAPLRPSLRVPHLTMTAGYWPSMRDDREKLPPERVQQHAARHLLAGIWERV